MIKNKDQYLLHYYASCLSNDILSMQKYVTKLIKHLIHPPMFNCIPIDLTIYNGIPTII